MCLIPPTIYDPSHDVITPLADVEIEEEAESSLYLQPFKVDLSVPLLNSNKSFRKESNILKVTPVKTKST